MIYLFLSHARCLIPTIIRVIVKGTDDAITLLVKTATAVVDFHVHRFNVQPAG